ncbi:MAG: hypothetical protein M1837_001163 [Sclerophora amabilis]|nr:MAG: hypothetical protein M1837_001163 [Sclerophora amabilis]
MSTAKIRKRRRSNCGGFQGTRKGYVQYLETRFRYCQQHHGQADIDSGTAAGTTDPAPDPTDALDVKLRTLFGRLQEGSRWERNLDEEERRWILGRIHDTPIDVSLWNPLQRRSSYGNDELGHLKTYSSERQKLDRFRDLLNQAINVSDFLFISWVIAACGSGSHSIMKVNEILMARFHITSSNYATLLRTACLFIHELNSWILEQDWSAECDDIFGLVRLPLSSYRDFARSRPTAIAKAKTILAEENARKTIGNSRKSPFAPVILLKRITADKYRLNDLCRYLHYSVKATERINARWSQDPSWIDDLHIRHPGSVHFATPAAPTFQREKHVESTSPGADHGDNANNYALVAVPVDMTAQSAGIARAPDGIPDPFQTSGYAQAQLPSRSVIGTASGQDDALRPEPGAVSYDPESAIIRTPNVQPTPPLSPTDRPSSQSPIDVGRNSDDTDALEAPHLGASAGSVISQPLRHVSNPGPQLQIPTQMRVPDTAQSIWFAMKGDIDGLKYLFSQGLASPRDVSNSRGFSLWALYGGMCNYKTVQFLLSQGASVDEDSYQHAWDYALRMKCSITELNELRCITLNPPSTDRDWIEEQQFPLIHNIVLGRSSKLLRAELDENPDAVRVTDSKGRTALDWATARARLSDMRLLIARGSPLDTMDVSGRTTVLHAVDSHNDDALRIVLEAGANPNPEVPKGLFRSSPLTAASFGGLVGMIKLLIEFGAKVDACNPEGRTALQAVASMQNVECADILLTCGADLGYISNNGHSPLTTAIIYNNHTVLKLFIDRCHISRLKGPQLLPIIAESADAETMSILASSDLPQKLTLLNGDGFALGRDTLRSRTDYDEKLGNAFEGLFSDARAIEEAAAFRMADDGIESGLSGSAPVS